MTEDDEDIGNRAEAPDVKPSTLKGIKKLAKKIKRRDGIKHTDALEDAARAAGYTNYQAAFNELGGDDAIPE